uniref:NTF2-related export protein n=1 Tax=Ciona intestinalis TaxID=7719 RepID=H2XJX4_CIOIN|nr:probable nuclear transport factor 2 [Ciona intestinalis]|eukprot:XP_002129876.1 probable nuclear transport factor 2 [Ciona intestinalis]
MCEFVIMPPIPARPTELHELGRAFAQHYYTKICVGRQELDQLYAPDSVMTFEGLECSGREAVMAKLKALTFKSIHYSITSIDCQPTGLPNTVFLMVLGQLKTDEDPPHSFCQTFILRGFEASFFIVNDVFRMVLHNA